MPEAPPETGRLPARAQLVLTAFLMLFVELALIRWLGANILYLAYFSNIVLLGSFLGIGLGFLWTAKHTRPLLPYAPLGLAILIVLARVLEVRVGVSGGSLIFFGLDTSGPPRWVVLPVVFTAVAAILTCLGDGVARSFKRLGNLDAYQLDLTGSLLGTIGFTVLSLFQADPIVWGVVAAVGLAVAIWPKGAPSLALTAVPLLVAVGFLAVESAEADTTWSPYYRVHTTPVDPANPDGGVIAEINGIPTWLQFPAVGNPIYETVYERVTSQEPGDVLIIGAGSGNDVAVAVARGADRIDAVEIDPHLLELGRGHPDRPYDDPSVVTHVADGRAFLERTDQQWDTILLALPDSLTLLQGQSSVRLESYLFTEEAVESYREHLAPGGTFAMYNYYRESWLIDRYAGTLADVFGMAPCVSTGIENLSVIVVSNEATSIDCPAAEVFAPTGAITAPATDDHPFPYLRTPSIPSSYLVTIAFMLLVSLIGVRTLGGPIGSMRPYADLFLMGVAFLLLETKHVVQFALLFGTTWFVNALVFIGVLASVLLAVILSKRVVIRRTTGLYVLLLASVAVNWLVPGHALLGLPLGLRLVVAISLAFFPIFTANLVFASRFRDTGDSTSAFGANLLGAMVGGMLEYSSLIIGYRNLLLLVAALYGAAFLLRPRGALAGAPSA
jgi:hypothetical protein